jgi:undecaprenyl-diphosphatase
VTRHRRTIGGLLLAAALITLDVVVDGPLTHVDRHVMLWVDVHQQPGVRHIADDVSALGNPLVALTLLALALVGTAARRRWRPAGGYGALSVVAIGLTLLLRAAVGRTSPTFGTHVHAGGSSFPSGHVLLVTLAMGAVALAIDRAAGLYVAAAVVLAVAAARVYGFAHFPTDVTAAALLGAVPLAVTWRQTRPA